MNKKTIAIILLFSLIIVGCKSQIQIVEVNHTIEKTIEVIKECPTIPDCICNCQTTKCNTSIYSDTYLNNCLIDKARAIAQADYYKNLSVKYIMNTTVENLQANYTTCISDKQILIDKLESINQSLN